LLLGVAYNVYRLLFRVHITRLKMSTEPSDLIRADLTEANLARADLARADLHEAGLSRANLFEEEGLQQAPRLETVRLTPTNNTGQVGQLSPNGDAVRIKTYQRPWPERRVGRVCLRGAGRLPLFGVSYTTLMLIPIIFYGLAIYHDKVELVSAWAEQVAALHDHPLHLLALPVLERLHPCPISSLSCWVLLSMVLLAAGSMPYTFFCPCRIKEFYHDQWCDQLGRSLLDYWAFAWKHRYIRLTCAACYFLWGTITLGVIGTKVWRTGLFIVQHPTLPWL
jgi:hypothetical protein